MKEVKNRSNSDKPGDFAKSTWRETSRDRAGLQNQHS